MSTQNTSGTNPVPGKWISYMSVMGKEMGPSRSEDVNWDRTITDSPHFTVDSYVVVDPKDYLPKDMVNHPDHYQSDTGVECIDAIRAALGKEGFIAYCRGNAIKYSWRDKDNLQQDLQKAEWYLKAAAKELTK